MLIGCLSILAAVSIDTSNFSQNWMYQCEELMHTMSATSRLHTRYALRSHVESSRHRLPPVPAAFGEHESGQHNHVPPAGQAMLARCTERSRTLSKAPLGVLTCPVQRKCPDGAPGCCLSRQPELVSAYTCTRHACGVGTTSDRA